MWYQFLEDLGGLGCVAGSSADNLTDGFLTHLEQDDKREANS